MSLPHAQLSTHSVAADWVGPDRFPFSETTAYEIGPIAFSDTSQGLAYQVWRVRVVGDTVYLTSPNTPEYPLFSKRCITNVSLSFDQNGRPLVAYLIEGSALWLYWYDPVAQAFLHTYLEDGVRDVCVVMPDKRAFQIEDSEVGVYFTKGDTLYWRRQLDRYSTAYVLQAGIGGRLLRVGMNSNYRLQFIFQALPYEIYSCTLGLDCL